MLQTAAQFYGQMGEVHPNNPARQQAYTHLTEVLQNTAVLTPEQQEHLQKIMPFFSTDVLHTLSESLIRENLRLLYKKSTKH